MWLIFQVQGKHQGKIDNFQKRSFSQADKENLPEY